jgi:hypothetical protein
MKTKYEGPFLKKGRYSELIPNLVADGVTEEMNTITEEKFRKWDEVIAKNYLEGTEEQRNYAYSLLQDVTIYAYAFFRVPGTSNSIRLRSYQDLILNHNHNRILFCAANQCGKSYSLAIKAIHKALLNPGKTVLLLSKTMSQSKDLLKQIKLILKNSIMDYEYSIGEIDNTTEIHFTHFEEMIDDKGKIIQKELPYSRIICSPASEASLGIPAFWIGLDEYAFMDNQAELLYQVILPRLFQTKGDLMIFSNPNGTANEYYKLWVGDVFHKFRFTFLDNPDNTLKEYTENKRIFPRAKAESTMDAIFSSSDGAFFLPEEVSAMQEQRESYIPIISTEQFYISLDFAKSHDHTCRIIGVPKNNGVYVHEIKIYPIQTPYNIIIDDLVSLIQEIGPDKFAMIGFDSNGPGNAISDWIKKIREFGIQIIPVPFSLQKKNSMYTILKLLAERNIKGEYGIKIPYTDEGDYQLKSLMMKTSTSGRMMIHHQNESDFDDVPDSLALLSYLIINPENPPVSVEIIGPTKNKKYDDAYRHTCGNIISAEDDDWCSFCNCKI